MAGTDNRLDGAKRGGREPIFFGVILVALHMLHQIGNTLPN